jgi:hypothetical protein
MSIPDPFKLGPAIESMRELLLACRRGSDYNPYPDNCEFCLGIKGGVRGNENRIAGIVTCDRCTNLIEAACDNERDNSGQLVLYTGMKGL